MLRITLEREQTYLFTQQHSTSINYELEVINQGPFAEIKLSAFTAKKNKKARRVSKKTIHEQEPMFLFQQ
jgi:hypothetical protein